MPDENRYVLHTIGHSNHTIEAFLDLLKRYAITAVADVRSSPYSRYCPQFNREVLRAALEQEGIAYVFLGSQLGARPEDPDCYEDDRVSFKRLAVSERFARGIERLIEGLAKYSVGLMCSEKDPIDCHRTILVCRNLRDRGVAIRHIMEDGAVEEHEQTERRLVKEMKVEPTLFEPDKTFTELAEEAYDLRAAEIACRADEHDNANA
ncbi:MAG: DUF488 domain-containing protein [Phycisphaerae bacterium]|nr:DUF488 domain-containing protein [Phycisphaerae bacterium]